ATLAFNHSDTVNFSGAISGTGGVNQIGPGLLILSGANTYTRGTTVSGGTLQFGNGATGGSIGGDATNNGTHHFDRSGSNQRSGAISGTGSIVQDGTGALILNGTNTYTGGTTVTSGILQIGDANHPSATISGNVVVNPGSTLAGHGTIGGNVVISGGTMSPGGS